MIFRSLNPPPSAQTTGWFAGGTKEKPVSCVWTASESEVLEIDRTFDEDIKVLKSLRLWIKKPDIMIYYRKSAIQTLQEVMSLFKLNFLLYALVRLQPQYVLSVAARSAAAVKPFPAVFPLIRHDPLLSQHQDEAVLFILHLWTLSSRWLNADRTIDCTCCQCQRSQALFFIKMFNLSIYLKKKNFVSIKSILGCFISNLNLWLLFWENRCIKIHLQYNHWSQFYPRCFSTDC